MARFLDSPAQLQKRIARIEGHFRHARMIYDATHPYGGLPMASDLVVILLRDAMYCHRMIPDAERQRLSRIKTWMPANRFSDLDAYELELSRLLTGMSAFDPTKVRVSVSADDVDRMVDVLDLLRFVRGVEANRDCRLVLASSAGLTLEQCARVWDRFRVWGSMREVRRLIREAEQRIAGQILSGMARDFGLVAVGPTLRRQSEERRRHAG